jgi:hypothetical protein
MTVLDELGERPSQVVFAEQDDPAKTLVLESIARSVRRRHWRWALGTGSARLEPRILQVDKADDVIAERAERESRPLLVEPDLDAGLRNAIQLTAARMYFLDTLRMLRPIRSVAARGISGAPRNSLFERRTTHRSQDLLASERRRQR